MSSRTYNLIGYGPVIGSKRAVFLAMSLLEAYQETVKCIRRGEPRPVEWTAQTETGRRMLGGDSRRAEDMSKPTGLRVCPRCRDRGCQICHWSGETTGRILARYSAWQLEPEAVK